MNSQLSRNNFVVITRGSGRYFVDKERRDNLLYHMNSANRPSLVELDGSYIALSDVVGIVSPDKLEEIDRQRRGDWKCSTQTWHKRDEVCKCRWGKETATRIKMPNKTRSELLKDEYSK